VSESSPPFRRAQANLSAPWMAPARRPMLQQGLKCFKEKNKIQKNKIKIFIFFSILPRWSRRARRLLRGDGGIGTRQSHQPTHVIKLNSSIGILLPSYSREIRSGGACSMSIQPISGWSCRVRRHPRRGRRYGSRQYSYLVCKYLGSKLKSNLSECSYLHSSL
jgi:hypothetical protein